MSRHVVDDAVSAGAIVIAHPCVYRLAGADDLDTRRRAALAYRPDGALSHTDALDVWGLPTMHSARVHVTVGSASSQNSCGLRLHRRVKYRPGSPHVLIRNGFRIVRIEQAIVESWGVLPRLDRRAPAIIGIRERRTTPDRILSVIDDQPWIRGSGELRRCVDLLAAGNHSELEIWGHQKVFGDKALPASVTQHRVRVGSGYVLLDRAFLAEMVAVELDGAAYHGSPGQRERDLRRDAALAELGWITVRYSHQRLHADPGGVVDELAAILARRRQQLRASA